MSATPDLSPDLTGLRVSIDAAARVVRVAGELDLATCAAVQQTGEDLASAAKADIALNLEALTFIDAAGLGAIVELRNIQLRNGQRLTMQGVPASIARIFDLAGLGVLLGPTTALAEGEVAVVPSARRLSVGHRTQRGRAAGAPSGR